MAVIGWYPQFGNTSGLDISTKNFVEEVLVHVDAPTKNDRELITTHDKCPLRFQQHPDDPTYYCIAYDLDQMQLAPNVYRLRITWATAIPGALLRDNKPVYDDNPLRRPIVVSSGYYTHPKTIRMAYKKDSTYDVKKGPTAPDVPVVTTAGERLFLQIEEETRMFICQKNVSALPDFMLKCGKFLNSDTVKFQGATFKPRELMACNIELSEAKFESGKVYYVMSFKLFVAPDEDGWCEKIRNAGYHEKGFYSVKLLNNQIVKVPYLKAITIGKPEDLRYPSSPVLLTPNGYAYRAPGVGQAPNTPFDQRTGPVLSTEGNLNNGFGLTEKDWKSAELQFWPRLQIPFKKFIPLT